MTGERQALETVLDLCQTLEKKQEDMYEFIAKLQRENSRIRFNLAEFQRLAMQDETKPAPNSCDATKPFSPTTKNTEFPWDYEKTF